MTAPLILASSSIHRRKLLAQLDVRFESLSPNVDERALERQLEASADAAGRARPNPEHRALELARAKANSIAAQRGDAFVLASDQIVYLPRPEAEARCFSKPSSAGAAVDQLCALAGKSHRIATAVVLYSPGNASNTTAQALGEFVDVHEMEMRPFSRDEARAYVERYQPLECAGAYRIEDAGISLFAAIRGQDYTGVIGLPLIGVARLLREAGLLVTAEGRGTEQT